jgi:hypothetical protein
VPWLRVFEPREIYKPCTLVVGVIFALRVKVNERCRPLDVVVKSSSIRAFAVGELSYIFTALLPATLVTIAPLSVAGAAGLTEVQPVGLEPAVSPLKSSENICASLEETTRQMMAMSALWNFLV